MILLTITLTLTGRCGATHNGEGPCENTIGATSLSHTANGVSTPLWCDHNLVLGEKRVPAPVPRPPADNHTHHHYCHTLCVQGLRAGVAH